MTVEDLLMDDGFLAWYHHTNDEEVGKWNDWIAASESNRLLAEKAVSFIVRLGHIEEAAITPEYTSSIFKRVEQQTHPMLSKARPLSLFRNYFKVSVRNLVRNKMHSGINVAGLSVGMAVAMLIGLWIWDEVSYNHSHSNHERIAAVWQETKNNGETGDWSSVPVPLAAALREKYPNDFQYVSAVSNMQFLMKHGDNIFTERGMFMEEQAPEMLSLKMLKGERLALKDPSSVMLSASAAKRLFGAADPIGQAINLNNTYTLKVAAVYEDIAHNSDFSEAAFIAPWQFFISNWDWIRGIKDDWNSNNVAVLTQLAPHADPAKVSQKIKDLRSSHLPGSKIKCDLFLYPMDRWHLHSNFVNGKETGGFIVYVRLFAMIGIFVLLLACINFMNLSTARSEKRAREVGIRKTMGSLRGQLIGQFFSESILISLLAFALSLLLVQLMLPWFNHVANKRLAIPALAPVFWVAGIVFSILTGLVAGSYPALYLSSFSPIKVLKGTFRTGKLAAIPRQVLVVLQFTVSVVLIIGTVVVFRQIQYAKDRPVGYDRNGLISIQMRTNDIYKNYNAIHNELLSQRLITEMSESQCPVTDIWANSGGFDWQGKADGFEASFAMVAVRSEFGKTVGWQFAEGRDFDKHMATDSFAMVLNESAVRYMGVSHVVGKTIRSGGKDYHVIGVIKDMLMTNPYQAVPQTIFTILREGGNFVNIKLSPNLSTAAALKGVEAVFRQYDPYAPFDYHFASEEYAKKFSDEERIGKLAAFFATLAIFISCLGLFGLASFVAEQRTREIGIRKVLGASIPGIWGLLSRDFVKLVIIALLIAMPVAWLCMHSWLQNYTYRAGIPAWIFLAVACSALLITLLTVSIQALRAAVANPVRSLRTE